MYGSATSPSHAVAGAGAVRVREGRGEQRGAARRSAAAAIRPPAIRRIAVRAELIGVGAGLTSRDRVVEGEPW